MQKEETINLKRYMHPSVHSSIIYNSQADRIWKQPVSSNRLMDKDVLCVCVCVYIYIHIWASQVVVVVKNKAANAGDIRDSSSTPGSRRSSGEGHGNPLQ